MGWCGGTEIFDKAVDGMVSLIKEGPGENNENLTCAVKELYKMFKDHDWDCEVDSKYISIIRTFEDL